MDLHIIKNLKKLLLIIKNNESKGISICMMLFFHFLASFNINKDKKLTIRTIYHKSIPQFTTKKVRFKNS